MSVVDLYNSGKIDHREYRSYLLYEGSDLGREYLRDSFEGVYMEEPPSLESEASFAWQDGRRSNWRDIKRAIAKVKFLLENSIEE